MAQQPHAYGAIVGDVDGKEENNNGRHSRSSVSLSKDETGRALGRVSLTDISSTREVDVDADADADAKDSIRHGGVLYKLMSKVMS